MAKPHQGPAAIASYFAHVADPFLLKVALGPTRQGTIQPD